MSASTSTHIRTCPLCEATCGLELTLDDQGEVTVIRGDREDVFSKGFVCPKGTTLHRLHTDPDRLRAPMVRRPSAEGGSELVEATWEEAFATVADGLARVVETHGRDALAVYLGNPSAHGHHGVLFGRPLVKALGTRNVFSASTVDQMPKHVSAGLMFGNALTIPVPDLDRTDHLLVLGANPWESNGSLCTAPDFPGRIEAIRARGGRVVVVDPRRTRTAEHADEHVRIRPGTDAMLLVAMANVLLAEGLADPGPAGEWMEGLDDLAAALAPFTPQAVSAPTGVDAGTIARLARDIAAAPSAAVYGRIGTTTVEFGTIASWAVDVLNALTGNLDRPGGAMWPSPAHVKARSAPGGRGYSLGRWSSRASGRPEANGELPVAVLAEEILTPGKGRVRALVTVAGNPVLSTPQSARLDAALAELDFMVCVDPALNETTRHADVILPPPSQLSKSQYDLAFYALAVRNIANWSPPLYEPEGPSEVEILARLALIASGLGPDADPQAVYDLVVDTLLSDATTKGDAPLAGRDVEELKGMLTAEDPADRALEVMIRSGQHGDHFGARPDGLTFERLVESPHGIDLGPLVPQLPDIISTPSGRVELAPAPIVADLGRLAAALDAEPPAMVLVGRRHLRSNNSWMHNVEVLVKGRDRCTLQVHPDDAGRLGLESGGSARVSSRVGSLEATVEVTDEVMPGVVSLPHGWGHSAPGTRMRVAAARPGVNSNVLTDAEVLDPLSGTAALNAIPVTLEPA
jgi:anaerobic selenocysteine-containing dehydrogenase